jgi:hypothetical protein
MAALMISRSNLLLLLSVFLLFSQPFLSALGQNAQIAGTVTDPSKAVIPNASIEIVETATQVKWETISNGDGRYAAPSLAPGVYQVTVQASTFETQIVGNLRLYVASKVSLDFVLHPGAVSRSVTVDGSGINLDTTDASVSTVIDRRLIENLPLNGRSFQSLMTLAPGVLALQAPELVAGIAIAGASLQAPEDSSCPEQGSVPLLVVDGEKDPIHPIEGGRVTLFGFSDRGRVLSAFDTAQTFAKRLGVTSAPQGIHHDPQKSGDPTSADGFLWPGAPSPVVALYKIEGGGHVVPQPVSSMYKPVGRAGMVASAMHEQRPGWEDGRTKKGACRLADSLRKMCESYAAFAFFIGLGCAFASSPESHLRCARPSWY